MPNFSKIGITIELVGGLGNQLFGYFAGACISKHQNIPLNIDLSQVPFGLTNHGVSIESFLLEGNFIRSSHKRPQANTLYQRVMSKSRRSISSLDSLLTRRSRIYTSDVLGYDPNIWDLAEGTRLRGYFQSWRYFDFVKRSSNFRKLDLHSPSDWYQSKLLEVQSSKPIILHVRRGDYWRVADDFGLLGRNYYLSALEYLRSIGFDRKVLVFSDQIDEAKRLFKNDHTFDLDFLVPPEGVDPAESLMLMSNGSAHIIANSTFSWWGAALADSKGPVVAPNKWFHRLEDPRELYPQAWHCIKSDWMNVKSTSSDLLGESHE